MISTGKDIAQEACKALEILYHSINFKNKLASISIILLIKKHVAHGYNHEK